MFNHLLFTCKCRFVHEFFISYSVQYSQDLFPFVISIRCLRSFAYFSLILFLLLLSALIDCSVVWSIYVVDCSFCFENNRKLVFQSIGERGDRATDSTEQCGWPSRKRGERHEWGLQNGIITIRYATAYARLC